LRNSPVDRPGFVSRAVAGACLVGLAVAGLAGCNRTVSSDSKWGEGVPHNQAFSRLLVVGLSPDANVRCAFENDLAYNLRSPTVTAKTSCSVLGSKEPITRESIERGIATFGADAVLATRLVDASSKLKEGGTSDTQGGGYYKATDLGYATNYWGVYGVPVVYGEFQTAPSLFSIRGTIRIVTSVYETRGATMVYSVETKAKNLESREQALVDITPAIAERLRRDGLVR